MSNSGGQKRPFIINLLKRENECSFAPHTESRAQIIRLSSGVSSSAPQEESVIASTFDAPPTGFLYEEPVYSSSDWEQSDSENESTCHQRKFQDWWAAMYPFIQYDSYHNVMFCSVCKMFATGRQRNLPFVGGSNNFKISSIQFHAKSVTHAKCQKLANESCVDQFEQDILDWEKEKVVHVLKSVYFTIKTKTPYNYFPRICEYLQKEGIQIGSAYTTHDKIVPHFAKYISLALEKDLAKKLEHVPFFSLILDSSVRRSYENHELVYIKYFERNDIKCSFLGVIDSKEKSGDAIHGSLTSLFENFGITEWTKKIVYLTCDKSNSFCLWHERLLNRLQINCVENFVCDAHCLPHKIRQCSCVFQNSALGSPFSSLIWNIFSYCRKVPGENQELPHIRGELGIITKNFGNLPKDTLITFYYDALVAVLRDWAALVPAVKAKRKTSEANSKKIKKLASKIHRKITKRSFLYKLAIFIDIFSCLDNFSKKLAKEDALPYEIYEELQLAIDGIPISVQGKGAVLKSTHQELLEVPGTFETVELETDNDLNGVLKEVAHLEEALVSHLKSLIKDACVLQCTDILNTAVWPQLENLIEYGNEHFSNLFFMLGGQQENVLAAFSEWFKLKTDVITQFPMDVRLRPKSAVFKIIKDFGNTLPIVTLMLKKVLLLSFSTSEVLKGYFEMNMMKTCDRSRLSPSSLQSSMIITMHGPPLAAFNPKPPLELWSSECKRRYRKRTGKTELEEDE